MKCVFSIFNPSSLNTILKNMYHINLFKLKIKYTFILRDKKKDTLRYLYMCIFVSKNNKLVWFN